MRNLKTNTGMDVLECQTPQMNDKQLQVHLMAYNLIRLLMAQAVSDPGVDRSKSVTPYGRALPR